jgi:ribonuclease HI
MTLEIFTDGGARGNPGPAAAGVVIRDGRGRSILEAGYFLGEATNNVAEYTAMLLGLEAAQKFGAEAVSLFADSELMVKQLTGQYKVRDVHLAKLFEQAQRLLIGFESWQIKHIRREQNRRADILVNKALDAGQDVVEIQLGDAQPRSRPRAGAEGASDTGRTAGRSAGSLDAAPDDSTLPAVIVKVTHGPQPGGCKGGTGQEGEFVFGETAPAGMCVYAIKAVLDTALAMRYAAGEHETLSPMRVRCGRRGCGAEFEVRLGGITGLGQE